MTPRRATILAVAVLCGPALAQDGTGITTQVTETPLFQAHAAFAFPNPDSLTGDDSFELDFTVAPDGGVSNVSLSMLSGGTRGDLCDPICWQEGRPPETVCLVMAGCAGTGGGGGTMLASPLILEFKPKEGQEGQLAYDFNVEKVAPSRPSISETLTVELPEN